MDFTTTSKFVLTVRPSSSPSPPFKKIETGKPDTQNRMGTSQALRIRVHEMNQTIFTQIGTVDAYA